MKIANKKIILIIACREVGDWTSGADLRLINEISILSNKYDFILLHQRKLTNKILENQFQIDLSKYFVKIYNFFDFNEKIFKLKLRLPGPGIDLLNKKAWSKTIEKIINISSPDLIHCDLLQACFYLPKKYRSKSIAFGQDVMTRLASTRIENEINLFKKIVFMFDWIAYRIAEKCYTHYFASIFVSDVDLIFLSSNSNSHVIPNGVELQDFDVLPNENIMCFGGNLSYQPNIDGITNFLDRYWVKLKKINLSLSLTIAGRNPTNQLLKTIYKYRDVKIIANPPNLMNILRSSRIVIAPISWGAGQKNKILEALSIGRPIVTDSHMIEGTNLTNLKHLIVATSEYDWTSRLVEQMNDVNLLNDVRRNGYEYVRKNYSWEASSQMLDEIYESSINK